jgi:hypothetical protein
VLVIYAYLKYFKNPYFSKWNTNVFSVTLCSRDLVTYTTQVSHVDNISKAAAVEIQLKFILPPFVVFESFASVNGSPVNINNGSVVDIKVKILFQYSYGRHFEKEKIQYRLDNSSKTLIFISSITIWKPGL